MKKQFNHNIKFIGQIVLVGMAACLFSCSSKEESAEADKGVESAQKTDSVATVTTMNLQPKMFTHEVVSNGKVSASEYADLSFKTADAVIEKIAVSNGQRVSKGQVLATLDKFKLENGVATARNNLSRLELDLADALIGQGYDPEKPEKVPEDVMRLARLRSGVAQAEVQLREAERALSDATLTAPFNGVVANLFQKRGNLPDTKEPFCRVIATSGMEIDFPVLESELALIHTGDAVEVTPYSSDEVYSGRVGSVNPVVDKDGMVKVSAVVNGGTGLYDGMNVRVSVKRNIEKALVVPKTAVVLRSGGRQVVFTHENGKAMWNYVTTSLENMNEYIVTEGLKAGQEVIVTGNINLAHESAVKVAEGKEEE
ncbi:MAG: efflux RND transporter periplasmic adaptor subunit [Muribaculaceae bacterium]|nr:efflux RND transporter periplasmic adaptor subunit [Muribaculaceae bacterium]